MKKLCAALLCVVMLTGLFGCGHPLKTSEKEYPTYGLFNEDSKKSKNVCYEISVGNVVWSIILVESIVFPIYFVGFSIYNPVRMKKDANDKCTFD